MAKGRKELTEKEILMEISKKLSQLLAINAMQGKEKDSQVNILTSAGFTNSEISALLDIPKGTVDFIRTKKKKTKSKG